MTNTPSPTYVVTGTVRLSYAHLFEPHSVNPADPDPKYSCVIMIPKTDKTTIRKIKAAQQAALEEGKAKHFGGRIPTVWKNTLHDGDEEADLDQNPEYAGHLYMSITSKKQPVVVDQAVNPILDSTEVYSGCYARVSMNAFPFSTQSKGVSFGLVNVQKVRDGEQFGGSRVKPEDDFEAIDPTEDDDDLL